MYKHTNTNTLHPQMKCRDNQTSIYIIEHRLIVDWLVYTKTSLTRIFYSQEVLLTPKRCKLPRKTPHCHPNAMMSSSAHCWLNYMYKRMSSECHDVIVYSLLVYNYVYRSV